MCDCITSINKKLETRNTRVDSSFPFSFEEGKVDEPRVVLSTHRADGKRGKSLTMVASYCPFCGTKYT